MLAKGAKTLAVVCCKPTTRMAVRTLSSATFNVNLPTEQSENNKNSPYLEGQFRSNAERRVKEVPVIEVEGNLAVCEGGGGSLGHPIEYITLDKVNNSNEPSTCIYCGLRYRSKAHHH